METTRITRTQVAAREKKATDRILRLRQLSHALCVLVRFFASRGNGGCVLALEPDTTTLEDELDGPATSSEPSPFLPWFSSVGLRLRFPDVC
jgi:hypothetical protein